MDIVIVEKRVKIGDVDGQSIWAWEFFDAVRPTKIKEWCAKYGFTTPKFGVTFYVTIGANFKCHLWEV